MNAILTLVKKDLATFRRNRAAVVITFLVPIALIYIFGWVFGLNQKDSGPTGIKLAVVNASTEPAAQKLVDALKAEKTFRVVTTTHPSGQPERPLTEADLAPMIHNGDFRFAVVIPADVVRTDKIGLHLKTFSDPRNEIEAQTVNSLLQKTIFSNVPELLGQSLQARARSFLGSPKYKEFNHGIASTVANTFGGDTAKIERRMEQADFGLDRLSDRRSSSPATTDKPRDFFNDLIKIEQTQVVGANVKSPAATRLVGGWAIMFLLFAVSGSSAAFFDEENAGLFQRVLSAPVTRAQLLTSRFLYGVILGLVQLTTMFIAGHFMYGIDLASHFTNLVIVSIFAAAACSSFGMLIAAIAPNATAASGLSTFVVMIMSATGGAWFPLSFMPEFMQKIGKFTVVYWSMEGFLQVLWADYHLAQLLPTLGVLALITALVMSVSIWRLNRKPIFR